MTLETVEYTEIIPMSRDEALKEVIDTFKQPANSTNNVIAVIRKGNEGFLQSNVRSHLEEESIMVMVPRGKNVILFKISDEIRKGYNTPSKKKD